MASPETRYAKTADGVHIAYQVVGDGPVDMVFVMGWVTNIEVMWDDPGFARLLDRLATFSRLILFDKRGVGLSDRVPEDRLPDLETRMDDVRAVMDAVGIGTGRRLRRLRGRPDVDAVRRDLSGADRRPRPVRDGRPTSRSGSPTTRTTRPPTSCEWRRRGAASSSRGARSRPGARPVTSPTNGWSRGSRRTCGSRPVRVRRSRSSAMNREINATHALPSIHVPTLVIAKDGRRRLPHRPGAGHGGPDRRRQARRAPGERALPVGRRPGGDPRRGASASWSRSARWRRSSTGCWRPCCSPTSSARPRQAAELGDRRWKELVEEHHRRVRGQLARYRGVEVDTAGDGFFATFDGPARAVRARGRSSTRSRRSGIEVRAGVHTGEVETIDGKVGGMAVVIGARVGASPAPRRCSSPRR